MPLVVGVVVLVLVLGVIAVAGALLLLTREDESLASAEAGASVDRLVDDADFDDGFVELDRCPLGSIDAVVAEVGRVASVGDLEGVETESGVFEGDENEPGVVCSRSEGDDEQDAYLEVFAASPGKGSYPDQIELVFGDAEVDVQSQESFRGGELYAYCVTPEADDVSPGCGADWVVVEDDLAVGLYAVDSVGLTSAEAADVLREQLEDLLAALADAQAGFTT